jgi:hypothetical protein
LGKGERDEREKNEPQRSSPDLIAKDPRHDGERHNQQCRRNEIEGEVIPSSGARDNDGDQIGEEDPVLVVLRP